CPPRPRYGGEGPGVRGPRRLRRHHPLTPNPSPPKRGRGEKNGEPPEAPHAPGEHPNKVLTAALPRGITPHPFGSGVPRPATPTSAGRPGREAGPASGRPP